MDGLTPWLNGTFDFNHLPFDTVTFLLASIGENDNITTIEEGAYKLNNVSWGDVDDEERRFVVHELNDATGMSSVLRRLFCLEACFRELKTLLSSLDSHVRRSGSSENTSDAKCQPLPLPPQSSATEGKPSNVEPQCQATATISQPARPAVDGPIRPPSRPTVTADASASGTKRSLAGPGEGRPPKRFAAEPPPDDGEGECESHLRAADAPRASHTITSTPVPSASMDGGVALVHPDDSLTLGQETADGLVRSPPRSPCCATTAQVSTSGVKRGLVDPERDRPPKRRATAGEPAPPARPRVPPPLGSPGSPQEPPQAPPVAAPSAPMSDFQSAACVLVPIANSTPNHTQASNHHVGGRPGGRAAESGSRHVGRCNQHRLHKTY